jgi:DNA polymerase I-like protein with 3'-5' exonuclease and polymerase domains
LRENRGNVESAVGHTWYFPDWDSNNTETRAHTERSAINLTCQGPASQMMTYLIYLTQQQFWKRKIMAPGLGFAEVVLTVHDSLNWEVGEDQEAESIAVVKDCLKQVEEWVSPWFKVPLILDIDTGVTWDA